ncbi:MAG: hypothetical protein WC178_05405 [Candidatus Paceibacterota bacterium]
MKKPLIVLICLIATTVLVLSAGCISGENIDPSDLASPGGNALQTELQAYATENYPYYESDMFILIKYEEQKLSVNDFCNDLYFSKASGSSDDIVLYSKTGFYIGPIVFLNNEGKEVDRLDIAISLNVGSQMSAKYANYTLVALDEINPKFKAEFKWFDIK